MPEIPFRIIGLDHLVLRVRNMEVMITFYCDILGCIKEREVAELDLVQLRAGTSLIDLVDCAGKLGRRGGLNTSSGSEGGSMDHFCLRIAGFDKEQAIKHLRAAGVRLGDFGTRYGSNGMGPSLYLYDPEGNMIELKGQNVNLDSN